MTMQKLLSFGLGLLLMSCGVPEGQLRISGTYESFKEGADLLLVSTDGGLEHLDTLHVVAGEFDYSCDLNGDATFHIVYADNSQLPLWVHSGDHIRIKEKGEGFWKVQVDGNEENELYAQFRLQNAPTDTIQLRNSASQFIHQHPASAVSQYLLCQYFVLSEEIPSDSINRLYNLIRTALPQNSDVAALGGQIQQQLALRKGSKMPEFDIITNDSIHRNLKSYKGKNLIMFFWAEWHSSSSYLSQSLYELKEELSNPTDGSKSIPVELLSYSLDIDTITSRINKDDGTKKIPTYCDLQGFNSPLANRLGVRNLPLIIVIDTNGNIKCTCQDTKDVRKIFKP